MVTGVALGVAVVIAIDLAGESARRGFVRSSEAVVGRATDRVVGGPSGVSDALFRRIRVDWGLRRSAPVVEGTVIAPDLGREPLRVLGVDPLSEAPFRRHLRGASLRDPAFLRLLAEPGTVLLGSALATRHHLRPGDALRVEADGRRHALRILGVIASRDPSERAALDGLLLTDVGAAQRLFGMGGRLTRVDLILGRDEARALRKRLPPGTRLVAAGDRAATASQLTDAFQLNLTALSLLALVVGMFLIYNTVTFNVVQRRAVLGTLRVLGVTRGQVFALVLAETLLASALGSGLGVALGWLLGQGAVRLVTRTINDLYYVLAVTGAPLSWASVGKGLGVGLGAGLLAAIAPALEASRVEPVIALRPSSLESRAHRLLPWVSGTGAALAAAGGSLLAGLRLSLPLSFAALFGVVVGVALLVPGITVALAGVAGLLAGARAGGLGRLAARTVSRAVGRTGVAVAALTVAVSVTIGVSLMIAGFRDTVANWLGLTLVADVYVSSPSLGRDAPSLDPSLPGRVAAVPGVRAVESYRRVRVRSDGGEIVLGVADPSRVRSAGLYRFAEAGPAETWERVRQGAVVVSEPFAYRHGIPHHGGSIEIDTDRGRRRFPVAGIFYDYSTEEGLVLMSRNVYEQDFDDRAVTSVAAYVARGESPSRVADRIRRALAGTALEVRVNRALRKRALEVFDRTFAVTQALRILAVVVAFIGVWSALLALQVERTRELATLRALGMTPDRLLGLTLLETGLMGGVAGLVSLPLGALLAVILVDVINVRSFGWTMRLGFDPWIFAEALLVSIVAALLAAVYPARRLRRLPVAEALRQE